MKENLLFKEINIPDKYTDVIKACMRNHIALYNYALQLLHNNEYRNSKALQSVIKAYVNQNNIYPIIKSPLFMEIYYLYKKFKRGIRSQKSITNIQYMTFIINSLEKDFIKINIDKKKYIIMYMRDFLSNDEIMELKDKVEFINLSYSTIENKYILSAFG